MTDPQSTIFEPAAPTSKKFSAALWCIGGHIAFWLSMNIYDWTSQHLANWRQDWLVPAIFMGLPLLGLLLLRAKRKVGWCISTIYFLFMGVGLAGTQIATFLRSLYGSFPSFRFDLRENIFMLVASACIYFLLHRETQLLLAIRSKERIWTASIAVVILSIFFTLMAKSN